MKFTNQQHSKLIEYKDLLLKWNKKINLISKSTENDIWNRHIVDSAQLYTFINNEDVICDMGAGAGLPGIILSIMGVKNVILIESDLRKSIFLNQAKNLSDNNVIVVNQRIENFDKTKYQKIDFVVARALAEVQKLFEFSKIIDPSKGLIMLKGENYKKELDEAQKDWNFDYSISKSSTSKESVILKITNYSGFN